MKSVSVKHMLSALPNQYSAYPIPSTPFSNNFHFLLRSKRWDFQDFQDYAKPSRLLPASQIEVCRELSPEKIISALEKGSSKALYKVNIQTSKIYGSGLTDLNSAVLLCLIDENGDSILQRIPSSSTKNPSFHPEDTNASNVSSFQRGCTDDFIFEGPMLGKVAALWVGVESGQWRIGGVVLTTIRQNVYPLAEDDKKPAQCIGYRYNFEVEDMLLGEGTDVSMVELRPSLVTQLSDETVIFDNENPLQSSSLATYISIEESMKEYTDLKLSLLLYDAMLVLGGTSIAAFLAGESTADAFLVGGLGGFFYLLLLQKSVDELPASELISKKIIGNPEKWFGKLKGPISVLVVAFGLAIVAAKYASGVDGGTVLSPQELMSGMTGFLMCKVAVVLAAFKPMPLNLRENE
ncbi:hypothetical protein Leryth_019158 [Lithospermum erythrorhizon]|nr:hypothetical protein Leryth_019158 [Lithospermum erythrorhizon]